MSLLEEFRKILSQARSELGAVDTPDALEASGISFTTEEIESILGGNAARIMEGR